MVPLKSIYNWIRAMNLRSAFSVKGMPRVPRHGGETSSEKKTTREAVKGIENSNSTWWLMVVVQNDRFISC